MQLKFDGKSLLFGLILGVVLAVCLGINPSGAMSTGGAGKTDFGIAVPYQGYVFFKTDDGYLYRVDGNSGKAEIVVYDTGKYKGRPINLRGLTGEEAPTRTHR